MRCHGRRTNSFEFWRLSSKFSGRQSARNQMRTAIYPGSFDPLTNGHLDVVQRAAKLFDRVIVAVAKNESKHPLFTLEERVELVRKSVARIKNVRSDSFDCLLVDYVERCQARAVVRGLRAVSDFEF